MTITSMKILGGPGDDDKGEKDYSTGIVKSPLTLSGPSTSRSRMCGKEAKYKTQIRYRTPPRPDQKGGIRNE